MHNQRLDLMEKMDFTLLRRLNIAVPPLFLGQRTAGERVKRMCLDAGQNRGKKRWLGLSIRRAFNEHLPPLLIGNGNPLFRTANRKIVIEALHCQCETFYFLPED